MNNKVVLSDSAEHEKFSMEQRISDLYRSILSHPELSLNSSQDLLDKIERTFEISFKKIYDQHNHDQGD